MDLVNIIEKALQPAEIKPAADEEQNRMTIDAPANCADAALQKIEDAYHEGGEWYDVHCCDKYEHEEYEVYSPISVKPYVHMCKPEAKCDGDMKVVPGHKDCKKDCSEYNYTLEQKLCVNIPVKYGVIVHYYKPCTQEDKE